MSTPSLLKQRTVVGQQREYAKELVMNCPMCPDWMMGGGMLIGGVIGVLLVVLLVVAIVKIVRS